MASVHPHPRFSIVSTCTLFLRREASSLSRRLRQMACAHMFHSHRCRASTSFGCVGAYIFIAAEPRRLKRRCAPRRHKKGTELLLLQSALEFAGNLLKASPPQFLSVVRSERSTTPDAMSTGLASLSSADALARKHMAPARSFSGATA